jgi:polyisoprenyl-teichoic acid--peptidoglycan teichoic acid transferase
VTAGRATASLPWWAVSSTPQPSTFATARPGARGGVRRRLGLAIVAALVVAAAGTAGTLIAAKGAIDTVQRTDVVAGVLSPTSTGIENFLLVGSDTRAGSDPSSPDYGGIGSEGDVSGSRSDTIMVLRRDRQTGAAALLSIPRDLWVTIPNHDDNRVNAAFNFGADVLVSTVQANLGIPIHHYIEIDFSGFKALVDSIGGVELCFDAPTRDVSTGLNIPEPGCFVLDGVQALAYARSRHYEVFGADRQWHEDGTADLGRTQRQRHFVDLALRTALAQVKANPFDAGDIMRSGAGSLTVDADLDLVEAAASLRTAVDGGLQTYALPVRGDTVDGKSVLLLTDGADPVLSFFRGDGPAPDPTGG